MYQSSPLSWHIANLISSANLAMRPTTVARHATIVGAMPKPHLSPLRIREWRQRAGLTQEQLAARIGSDKGTISSWENGKKRANTEWLEKLALELQCDIPDLYRRPDDVADQDFFRSAPDDVRSAMVAYGRGILDGRK